MNTSSITAPRPSYDPEIQALHPIARREETMFLKTLNNGSSDCLKILSRDGSRDPCSLRTDHILLKANKHHPTENFMMKTDDLNQKRKQITRAEPINTYNSLYNEDIPFAKTKVQHFATKRAPTNPLEPCYSGFKEEQIEPVETKFIRDAMNVTDIDGAQTHWRQRMKHQKLQELSKSPTKHIPLVTCQLKDVIFNSEPHAGKNNPELELRKLRNHKYFYETSGKYSNLDVSDIAKCKAYKISNRCLNPLDPNYFYYDINRNPTHLDPIKKAHSSIRHPARNKVLYNLQSQDIEGACPNTNHHLFVGGKERKDFHKTNDLSNIQNVHPGSCKKSIKTKRCLNPNMRDYPIPDGYYNGFEIGIENKKPEMQLTTKHGKKIVNTEERLKEKKNWNIINHKVKDPNIKENFRSEGKMIKSEWIKPPNDIFILDSNFKEQAPRFKVGYKSTSSLRDPISGVGVDSKDFRAVVITDEDRLQFVENIKKSALKSSKSYFKTDNNFILQQAISQKAREPRASQFSLPKLKKADNIEFSVSFKPIQTHEQRFDSFVTRT